MLERFLGLPKDDRPKHPHKVCECRRQLRPVPGVKGHVYKPAVLQHKASGGTFYGGHIICGSFRACPPCAQTIGETRSKEIRQASDLWMAADGLLLFVTPTFPHYRQDSLADLLAAFKDALANFRKGRPFECIKQWLGYSGLIRSMETTWGERNGWHPHSHELWFLQPGHEVRAQLLESAKQSREHYVKTGKRQAFGIALEIQAQLWQLWTRACLKAGLPAPSFEHGIRVDVAENEEQTRNRIAEYLAKTGLVLDPSAPVWGADDELVKVHSKRGSPGRFTAFDFLREQYNPQNSKREKAHFRRLFAEFIEAYRGMASVFWSKGLKAQFKIQETTDQEAADNKKEPANRLADIHGHHWAFVIGVKDHRAELLNRASDDGSPGIKDFLDELLQRYYLEHYADDFQRLTSDAQYLLSLSKTDFVKYTFDP